MAAARTIYTSRWRGPKHLSSPAALPRPARSFSQAAGQAAGGAATGELDPATASRVVAIPLHPSVTVDVIVLAVLLALLGGLVAGALGSWRIARLSPADALALVA